METEVCPSCASSKKQRLFSYHKATLHDYTASAAYVKPVIAIACNSGIHEEHTASWQESVKVMAQHKIPMVFTSYNELEAEGEGVWFGHLSCLIISQNESAMVVGEFLLAVTQHQWITCTQLFLR
jgi:hypothetical protein